MLGMDVNTIIEQHGGILALAEKVGVDRATVYDWKRSKFFPASRIAQIHATLGIDLATLVSLTKPPAMRRVA